jgi:hypothetical protein
VGIRGPIVAIAMTSGVGCTFGAQGGGGGGQLGDSATATTGATTDDGASDEAVDASTAGSGPADSTSGVTSAGSITNPTADGADGSDVVFVDAPAIAIGDVAAGSYTFTVGLHNVGGEAAAWLSAEAPKPPLAWAGGTFPGTGGDCDAGLAPGATCNAVVEVQAGMPGLYTRTLTVASGAGETTLDVTVGAVGDGPNLVDNGGAEEGGGGMLPSWSSSAGNWYATTDLASAGAHSIVAGNGIQGLAVLFQDVPVSAWAEAVDGGGFGFVLRADTRSYSNNNDDPHALRLRYLDAGGGELIALSSPWIVSSGWQTYEGMMVAPPQTATVRIELVCDFLNGVVCNGYFDEVRLVPRYPVAP